MKWKRKSLPAACLLIVSFSISPSLSLFISLSFFGLCGIFRCFMIALFYGYFVSLPTDWFKTFSTLPFGKVAGRGYRFFSPWRIGVNDRFYEASGRRSVTRFIAGPAAITIWQTLEAPPTSPAPNSNFFLSTRFSVAVFFQKNWGKLYDTSVYWFIVRESGNKTEPSAWPGISWNRPASLISSAARSRSLLAPSPLLEIVKSTFLYIFVHDLMTARRGIRIFPEP